MASQGPLSVAAGASIAGPDGNWTTPGNITASDNVYATAGSAGLTDLLAGTAPGFSIPAGATINGILVEIEASTVTAGSLDEAWLTKDGSTVVGNDGISGTQALTTTETYYAYGGATDLWGTTWTVAQINASTFGALIRATRVTSVLRIDHVRITVYYTAAGGTPVNFAPSVVGAGTATATVRTRPLLAPSAIGAATVTATLRTRPRLAPVAVGASTVTATLRTAPRLSVTTTGAATVTAALQTRPLFTPTATGSSTVAATLRTIPRLSGAVAATSAVAASLRTRPLLSATATATALVTATLTSITPDVPGDAAMALRVRDGAALSLSVRGAATMTLRVRSGATLVLSNP